VSERAVRATNQGFGRVLVVVYAIFAIGATSRSVIQIVGRYDEAPIAYSLSALAAVVYIVATVALARGNKTSRKVAYVAVGIEMAGVLIIGAISVIFPETFPRATVWSNFGSGYLFIPLVLPPMALWWLRRTE
jgi:cytochrome bd-type quinol oxidase subunit 2